MLLTLKAAALRLGVCTEVARRELAGLSVRVGNRPRYPEAVVTRYAERGTASPKAAVRPARERDERAVLG